MPNLQRQSQELGRARHPVRDLCGAPGGNANELEKDMTTEQYAIGYEAGYQDGWDAALAEQADDARCRQLLEAFDDAPEPAEQVPVAMPSSVRKAAYDQIDRFLRNNLHDDDYADYSAALDSLYTAPQPAKREPLTDEEIISVLGDPKYSTITAVRELIRKAGNPKR